jgi:thiosulfate/3-mercaptopyruvate sulfurtransferase
MGNIKRLKFITILFITLLFIAPQAFSAGFANPGLLVTPADIEKNAGKWTIIDCRDAKTYAAGHIPGAVNLGDACAKILRDTTLRVKKTGDLEKLLGETGVSMDRPVVVYADAKLITGATVAFWILEYLGHNDVGFLNGGIEEWQSSGRALESGKNKPVPATFKANIVKNRIATTDEVVKIAKGEITNVNLIDSRSEKEHKGEDIRSLRGGHIPNTTINAAHTDTYHVETGTLFSPEGLESIFGKLDRNKRTIPYCQTGTRSTLIYLELRLMGFKEPANYDDSWIIYGSNPDHPVTNENWYDFVKVNDALKAIDGLKKEIEELKKK